MFDTSTTLYIFTFPSSPITTSHAIIDKICYLNKLFDMMWWNSWHPYSPLLLSASHLQIHSHIHWRLGLCTSTEGNLIWNAFPNKSSLSRILPWIFLCSHILYEDLPLASNPSTIPFKPSITSFSSLSCSLPLWHLRRWYSISLTTSCQRNPHRTQWMFTWMDWTVNPLQFD